MTTERHYLGTPTREGVGGGFDSGASADLERRGIDKTKIFSNAPFS